MNNVTFGDGEVGYYETVAGGAGAVRLLCVFRWNFSLILVAKLKVNPPVALGRKC